MRNKGRKFTYRVTEVKKKSSQEVFSLIWCICICFSVPNIATFSFMLENGSYCSFSLPYLSKYTMLWFLSVTGKKMALKITVLASGKKWIQARHKDSFKVIVKFIRKGIHFQQTESGLSLEWEQWSQEGKRERNISCSSHRKWEQKLKMVVSIS
jgi:hypothetical protein